MSSFSSKIICGCCGSYFGSKVWHSTDKYRKVIWQCNKKYGGKDKCPVPHLTEDEIKDAFVKAANELIRNKKKVIADMETLLEVASDTSSLQEEADGLDAELAGIIQAVDDLIEENARKVQDQEEYNRKYSRLIEMHDEKQKRLDEITGQIKTAKASEVTISEFIKTLQGMDGAMTEFKEKVWNGMVESLTVGKDGGKKVRFKGGIEVKI